MRVIFTALRSADGVPSLLVRFWQDFDFENPEKQRENASKNEPFGNSQIRYSCGSHPYCPKYLRTRFLRSYARSVFVPSDLYRFCP